MNFQKHLRSNFTFVFNRQIQPRTSSFPNPILGKKVTIGLFSSTIKMEANLSFLSSEFGKLGKDLFPQEQEVGGEWEG